MFNEQFVILLCMCVSVTKERQIWDERWVWYGAGAGFGDEEIGMRDRDERWAWYGAGLRVAIADGVIWCWVAGSGFGDGVAVLCGAGLRVAVADGVIWC